MRKNKASSADDALFLFLALQVGVIEVLAVKLIQTLFGEELFAIFLDHDGPSHPLLAVSATGGARRRCPRLSALGSKSNLKNKTTRMGGLILGGEGGT